MSGPEMYDTLRTQALQAVSLGLPAPPPEHPGVAGAVVDVPVDGDWITVVAMGEGSTSMYSSTGGGTIGAGQHELVAAATHSLLATVEAQLSEFEETDDAEHPGPGAVRVFALMPDGTRRVADAPQDAFWGRTQHVLTPLLMAVQDVVSAMRQISPPND